MADMTSILYIVLLAVRISSFLTYVKQQTTYRCITSWLQILQVSN